MNNLRSNILKKIILPIADKVMHTKVIHYFKKINKMQKWENSNILEWQNKKIQHLIEHAYNNTVYYKKLFDKNNIDYKAINSRNDLYKIPILTKEIIRKHDNDLVPKNVKNIYYNQNSTGGSSGDPLIYLLDNNSWSFNTASIIYNWEKTSYKYGEKFITLGSSSLFVNEKKSIKHLIYYMLKNSLGLNGINMSDNVCQRYVSIIKKKRIKYLYGYASSIFVLANYIINNSIKLDIKVCFPTSEILTNVFKERIINAFDCEVVDFYGAFDGGITAFEQKKGSFFVGYNSIVNQVERDKNGIGPILITDLFNYAMPFINYQLGDEVQINSNKGTDIQYNGQIINKILGRISDIIELENGTVITGPGFTILFKDMPVEYYRIEKIGVNAIRCVIIKLDSYKQKHEEIIISTFRKQLGPNVNFKLEYTTDIILSKSGKRQYFNS